MVFKKKRCLRDLLRAALVIFFFIGVPIWLLVIALIVDLLWMWFVFFLYIWVAYVLCWRVDEWMV